MHITLTGEAKSTQQLYKSVCRGNFPSVYMTQQGKDIKEQYYWEAKTQYKGAPLMGALCVSLTFYFKTKHKRDLDNQNKLILDALSGVCWIDDAQIEQLILRKCFDLQNPRIEIEIVAEK